ncbi:MAG TPA: tetratricopeptide repeat protein, partial [Thermoanaerobaculia bacterium]|nr:tetratricopeptide repeat protein [Thermoanaerobaculia bacterium]
MQRWLVELQHRFSAAPLRPLAEWATDETLAIPGFEITRAAEFYPQVYSRRFRGDPDEGFAQLESMMEGKDPSFGYSVLAQVLAATRHRVVITTNFDHLVADALAIYTRTHPLVCGHESLTSFVRARMRRPLIAKIHRDLLLAPFSSPEETASLAAEWKQALRTLFQHFVPIVIGYGGNDGSFMGFLEALQPGDIAGRLFWCYRQQDGLPAERIRTIVSRHSGVFVPILGFDELMLLLGERLGFGLLNDAIDRSAQERKERYQAQVDEIMSRLGRLGRSEQTKEAAEKVGDALAVTLRDSGATAALFTAQRTEDTHEKTKRYREALERYPNDRATWRGYARAAASEIGDRKLAARLYRDAIRKFPSDVGILLDAAHFFGESHNYKRSRELYERVLKVAPNNAVALNELGLIAIDERNPAEAESFYRRALTIMPSDPVLLTNLAIVLSHDRGRYEEAERHFRNALEIRPGAAPIQINFVMLLFERERFEEA